MPDPNALYPTLDAPLPTAASTTADAQQALANYQAGRTRGMPAPTAAAPILPENSVLTDIGHGLARGVMVEAPEMAGRILQTFGLDSAGKGIEKSAQERGNAEMYRVTGLAGNVASMVPTVAGLAGLALIPGVGEAAAARIAGGLFAASQYTATREKGGGILPSLGAAAVQGIGQTIGVGALGRLVSGTEAAVQRGALAKGFESYADPSLWGAMGRGVLRAEATQLPAQAATAAGTAAFESGLPGTASPWDAAKQSFAPTALLTAVMGPFAAPAIMKTNAMRASQAAALENPNFSYARRSMAANNIAADLRALDPEGSDAWRKEALAALNDGVTPELRPDYKYDTTQQMQQPAAPAPAAPVAAQPPAPNTPLQDFINQQTGVTGGPAPQYTNKFDAQLAWKHMFDRRAAEEAGSVVNKALTDQLVANPPEGVMPFAAWVQAQRTMKTGPLAKGGRISESGLKDAYVSYVNDEIQKQPAPEAAAPTGMFALDQPQQRTLFEQGQLGERPFELQPSPAEEPAVRRAPTDVFSIPEEPKVPEGQGELDLQPLLNQPAGAPRPDPYNTAAREREAADKAAREAPEPPAPPQTAMEQALRRAGITPERTPTRGELEADHQAAIAADPEGDLARNAAEVAAAGVTPTVGVNPEATRLPRGPEVAARVAAANKLADDAMAGKITGNTPLAVQDFAKTWIDAATAAGAKRPHAGFMNRVLEGVKGKTLYVQQLNALRAARDAVKDKTTESYEGLSRLIARLESYEGPYNAKEPSSADLKAATEASARAESRPTADETWSQNARDVEQGAAAARDAESRAGADQAAQERATAAAARTGADVTPVTPGEPVAYGDFSKRPPTQEELNALLNAGTVKPNEVNPDGTLTAAGAKRAYEVEKAKLEVARAQRRAEQSPDEQAAHQAAIDAAQQREDAARAAFAAAHPELHEARMRLAQLEAQSNALKQMRADYNAMSKIKTPSADQYAARQALVERIKQAAAAQREIDASGERETLAQHVDDLTEMVKDSPQLREYSEAVGATEKAKQRGEGEPAATDEYYSFTNEPLDPKEGIGTGSNLVNVFRYLEAHKYAGTLKVVRNLLPKEMQATFDAMMSGEAGGRFSADAKLGGRAVKTQRTATEALGTLDAATHKRFADYVTHLVRSIQTAARVNAAGIAEEKNIARALRESVELHAQFDYKNAQIEESLRSGALTQEAADSLRRSLNLQREGAVRELQAGEGPEQRAADLFNQAYTKYRRDIAVADAEKTGLARLDNAKLAARVAETPHAMGVLEHLGRTHHNVIIRAVAKLLAKANPTATIRVIENPDFNGGRYVPFTNTIEIGRGGMNTTTMLHEITHALTHAGTIRALANLVRPDSELSAQDRVEVQAIKTVQGIMERFSKIADQDNPAHMLALNDEHEFLSEAMNNPDLQRLLGGRANLLTRVFDVIRDLVPAWKRARTDFEQLMQAAPTLFGSPNRSLTTVYRSPLNRTGESWFMPNALRGFFKLGTADSATKRMSEKPDAQWNKGLAWFSLNHQKQVLRMVIDKAIQQFPTASVALTRIAGVHDEIRQHVADRAAIATLVKLEGGRIADTAWKLFNTHRALSDRVGRMGSEAARLQVDPTLPVKPGDSPDVQRLKNEYQDLKRTSEQLQRRAGGKPVATPMAVYHGMTDFHDLMLTRHTAQAMKAVLQTYGMHELPEMKSVMKQLDTREQAGRDMGSVPLKTQRQALQNGMQETMRIVKEIHDRELAAGGAQSKGAQDAGSLRAMLDDQYGNYSRLREVPYMHLGRAGDKMVMFTVNGGDAEWKRVGAVVDGLRRGWGPPRVNADGTENRRVYMRFDNNSHYEETLKQLRPFLDEGLFKDANGQNTWADGPISEKLRSQDSATPGYMHILRDRIANSDFIEPSMKPALTSMVFDTYLQQLPDNSPYKASATSDGLNGYSTDYIRNFGERTTMSMRALQGMRSSTGMSNTLNRLNGAMKELREDISPGLSDVKTQIGKYMADVRGRVEDLNTPVDAPVLDRLRAFPAAWRLALSPAYMTMLAVQPWQMTLPTLGSKHGYGAAALSMAKNTALAYGMVTKLMHMGWLESSGDKFSRFASLSNLRLEFSKLTKADGSSLLNEAQLDLMSHAVWSSLLNFGVTHEVARLNPEDQGFGSKTMQAATVFPHMIEVANRLVSALSAHELMMDKADPNWRQNNGNGALVEGSRLNAVHEKAKDHALQTIRDTDGDHSQANIARNLGRRGVLRAATPLAVGFGQFDIQATEMFYRNYLKLRGGTPAEQAESAKTLAGIAGMTGMMAGTLGMPFMGALSGLANMFLGLIQNKEDTPPDVQQSVRHFTGSVLQGVGLKGEALKKTEEVISRGLPRLFDIDMSTRSGFADLAPFTSFLEDRRKIDDRIKDHAFEFLGPSIGAMAGIATGLTAASEGDWVKFFNDATPAVVRNAGTAALMAQHGYETEGANNIIPIGAPSAWNILAQAGGFKSSARAEQSEASFAFKTTQQLLERRQQILRNEAYRAVDRGDYAALGELFQENIKMVMRNPQLSPNLLSGLPQRYQERAVGTATGTGILAPKKAMYPIMQQFPQIPQ